RSRARTDFQRLQHFECSRIDHCDVAVFLRRDVDELPIGPHFHALGFTTDLQTRQHMAVVYRDDARFADVLVGDEQAGPILTDRRLLRVGTSLYDARPPVLRDTDDTDAVAAFVWRWKLALVHTRSRDWRTAERNVERLAIGADANAAGLLAHRECGQALPGCHVDDA